MNPFEEELFKKGYCKLRLGSYRIWISKKWHEFFVRRGLVQKNFYGQYCPNTLTLTEFIKWSVMYDKAQHDRDYPNSNPQLTPQELQMIKLQIT